MKNWIPLYNHYKFNQIIEVDTQGNACVVLTLTELEFTRWKQQAPKLVYPSFKPSTAIQFALIRECYAQQSSKLLPFPKSVK